MRSSSRIHPAESLEGIAGRPARFDIGALQDEGPDAGLRRRATPLEPPAPPPSPEELARAAHELAWREGFDAGYREGAQAFDDFRAQQLQQAMERFAAIAAAHEGALERLRHEAADGLIDLSVELARLVVRGAVDVDRERVLPVVREALDALGETRARPLLRLAPEDAELVRTELGEALGGAGVAVQADAAVQPGGCLLEGGATTVDATLASRWQRVLAQLGREDPWLT